MSAQKTVDEVTELERMGYLKDNLAIDITGLDLKGVLWVWAYTPKPEVPGGAYEYPYKKLVDDCTSDNSVWVKLAGDLVDERGGRKDIERIWVPLRIPDVDLSRIKYLILNTDCLDIPGWGK
jgi:hypothetical protein